MSNQNGGEQLGSVEEKEEHFRRQVSDVTSEFESKFPSMEIGPADTGSFKNLKNLIMFADAYINIIMNKPRTDIQKWSREIDALNAMLQYWEKWYALDNSDVVPPPSAEIITDIASKIPIWQDKDEGQEYRERLVSAFVRLVTELKGFIEKCDSIFVDQNGADLPGAFFEELCGLARNSGTLITENAFASRKRTNRISGLEADIRAAYAKGTIGNKILIVTEHADSGKTCETLSKLIREVGREFGKSPEIRIASVSVHQNKFVEGPNLKEKWVWGEKSNIGSSAFKRENLEITREDMARFAENVWRAVFLRN